MSLTVRGYAAFSASEGECAGTRSWTSENASSGPALVTMQEEVRGQFAHGGRRASVTERRQIQAGEQRLALAEKNRAEGQVNFVDQARGKALTDNPYAAA